MPAPPTITTVTVGGTGVTALPGTFVFRAIPKIVRKPNEPRVVTGANYELFFEADEDDASTISSSTQGTGSVEVSCSGFPTIYKAVVNVESLGEGIQKRKITVRGTKES